jgi:hypothetical protein
MGVKTAPRLLLRSGIITLVPGPPVVSAGLTVSARAVVKGGVKGDHSGGAKGNHFQRVFERSGMRWGAAGAEPCEAGGRAGA